MKRTLPAELADNGRPPGRWGFLAVGIWLFYLVQPLTEIWQTQHGVTRILGLLNLLAFAVAYLGFFAVLRWQEFRPDASPLWQRLGYLLFMLGLALLLTMTAGQTALTCMVYIAATAVLSLRLPLGVAIVLLLLGGVELAMRVVPGWSDDGSYGFAIFLGGLAVFAMRVSMQRSSELSRARQDMAELAVQEERNRFARDLHDILGHSLTVITVKAELAGRLIQANPERAAAEVADVESLARAALGDVRAAVAGYREISLAGELVSARTALQAAEIKPDLPTTLDEVPEENRELFAWVIREGVTNVIRHSGAKRCTIKLSGRQIEVLDDGKGPTAETSADGHGLIGLRERAHQTGAGLQVGQAPGGGFRLAVKVGP
ncbi:sensor histidine kinase [Kribbella antibiotica]|uniref:Sensor histidine kinase n=1 Tax=Kribbella antibiotica TaxID=190195 RepID=A0A4R4Z3V1_9ACTN|nr:sensor histidine kinase [Kribbella antibiotica]TDD52110.1 sensor histidine kinase [Kribbella antibiotica]